MARNDEKAARSARNDEKDILNCFAPLGMTKGSIGLLRQSALPKAKSEKKYIKNAETETPTSIAETKIAAFEGGNRIISEIRKARNIEALT